MNTFEEKSIFKLFQKAFKNIPFGTAEFSDAPDVIYKLPSGKIIGIEITEAVYDEKSIGSREGQIKFNYDVIEKLCFDRVFMYRRFSSEVSVLK